MKTCEVCGQRVRLHSSDEGTSYYEGIDSQELQEVEAKLAKAEEFIEWVADHTRAYPTRAAANKTLAAIREMRNAKA